MRPQAAEMPHTLADSPHPLADLPTDRLPRHVAIIMDGNGRWAVRQGLQRFHGHRQGMEQVRTIVTEAAEIHRHLGGFSHLTLYSFSLENWRRPPEEVRFLMDMYVEYLRRELPTMMRNDVRFNQIGRLHGLPDAVLDEVERTRNATANNRGLLLTLALNYGGRAELVDAARSIARDVRAGHLSPDEIDDTTIQRRLYTADMPDVDLLIRTAGESRVSNYLLWQISYAEIHVSGTHWPAFGTHDLHAAVRDYARRNRRFGGLDATNTLAGR